MVTGSERSLKLSGYVSKLSIDEINVPLQFRNVFEHALPDPATGARLKISPGAPLPAEIPTLIL
jgi:hypothetical protein